MTKLIDDCFVLDKDRLPHHEALAILRSRVHPVAEIESVPLAESAGRFLAEPVVAPRPIPAHDNAAVDGYAFAYAAYNKGRGARLKVIGQAAAGHPFTAVPPRDGAVRIFTGAVMPQGLDTVAMQEDVRLEQSGDQVWAAVPPGLRQGANRRLAGEDAKQGVVLAERGMRLRPQELAAAAATGLNRLVCYAPLKVAIVSTGDEIIRPGADFAPGKVYDANAPMLQALVRAAGAEPADLGVLPDQAERVKAALGEVSRNYDVMIVSGGASQGAEDHVVRSLDALGKRHLWQIAIKPGRPMSFGQIGDCVVLGLPGNPVAVFVCFVIYVRPVLTRLAGGAWPEPRRFPLPAAFAQTKKARRREFWRARLTSDADGNLQVAKFPRDGSGLISSLREADGLIEIGEDVTEVKKGQIVDFIPFTEFGLSSCQPPIAGAADFGTVLEA
ncbi:MAG TPA: gephyrin-like molybdotransferase Glp [Methyloceanibacter sp.]|nr:gephyrin-like molybdotransferase Glp [Methyloceanibacter sp.]